MKIWGQKLFILFFVFALPSISVASEFFFRGVEDKVYIQPDSIHFSDNQMYLKIEEDLIPIQHLACDNSGIFISLHDIQAGCRRRGTWVCRNEDCRYENYDGINYCGLCGWPRYAE